MNSFEIAHEVDLLNLGITGISALVTLGIFVCIVYFCIKYRSSNKSEYQSDIQSYKLEIIWTTITMVIFIGLYFWGSSVYKKQVAPKKPDYKIFVFAKQWMWKFHHQNGFVEIDHLHIPKDKNIRFIMTSKDVIHSFYLPTFRYKQDVLPEVYSYLNLNVNKTGEYPLFCAEYCGTDHSIMRGSLTVMNEQDYLTYTGMKSRTAFIEKGQKLFRKMGCVNCHGPDTDTGPNLTGLADDNFIRQSILYPAKDVTPGYEAVMPSFKDQLPEEDLRALIEYIKSMRKR